MNCGRNLWWRLWWVGFCAFAAGCQMEENSIPPVQRPSVRMDPCAERLHDICGHLLLYHSVHNELPPTLEQLRSTSDVPLPSLVCPASGKAYTYNPGGLASPDRKGRLVMYDPEPSHSGMRWAIMVGMPADGGGVTARVILLPESEFAPVNAGGDGSQP